MLKHPRKVKLDSDRDVHQAIDGVIADGVPRLLMRDGETVAVIVSPEDYTELSEEAGEDIWSTYDPDRARRALQAGVGALAGVDREQLLRDLHEARGQASAGRPE